MNRIAGRLADLERRLPDGRLRYLGVAMALYVGLYGAMLAVTRGVPYVTDGNESFSMFVHASNLYHFPLSQTFGLSDEAYSPLAPAHPYVYTHQGNFPRLFAFLLYVAGARSVESQIVITTFTVGLLAVLLIFEYFSAITNAAFALVATAIVLTDYMLFAQWQVNTFRVWHGLFFFLSLVCVHRLDAGRRRVWLAITFLTFLGVFYFELVFGAFVAVMGGLYAGARYWRRPTLVVQCWVAQAAGAMTAVFVLVAQLIGYLGWTDFLQDLRLTYTARNVGGADQAYIDSIRDFVNSRHLVFWYNFAHDYQRTPFEILSSVTHGYFTTYTPALWYLTSLVTLGWAGAMCLHRVNGWPVAGKPHDGAGPTWSAAVPVVLLSVAWSRFLLAILQPAALTGITGSRLVIDINTEWMAVVVAVAAGVGAVALTTRTATGRWFGLLPPARAVVAAGILLAGEQLAMDSVRLFDPSLFPLWSHIQGTWAAGWIVQLLVVAAAAFATAAVLFRGVISDAMWPGLLRFFACGVLAYVFVYALSPGYLETGYLERSVPFASFIVEAAIALVVYLAWSVQRQIRAGLALPEQERQPPPSLAQAAWLALAQKPLRALAAGGALYVFLFVAAYWTRIQVVHVGLVPPTDFMFIQQLGQPPFRGASFAVSTYAAPVYAYTGTWAYFDDRLGDRDGGAVTKTATGYTVNRDGAKYLWLADRQNQEYQRPQYFLCYQHQDLHSAVQRLTGNAGGCSSMGPVRYASDRTQPSIAREVMARDESGRDSWAIVKLDWSILDRHPHGAMTPIGP